MAGGDTQEKTEKASPKKLSDAKKKGQVAKSQDLSMGFILFVSVGMLFVLAPYMGKRIALLTRGICLNLTEPYGDIESLGVWAKEAGNFMLITLIPFMGGLFVLAIIINVMQMGLIWSSKSLEPSLKKINLFDPSNYKKFFDLKALIKLIFGILKLIVVGVVGGGIIYYLLPKMSHYIYASIYQFIDFIFFYSLIIAMAIAIILLILGVFDFLFQKWKFAQEMKMSKQDVKEEMKQSEGDAQVKSKLRSSMLSLSQGRMKSDVPKADVIVANPVHYAIAIKYDAEKMPAPVCLAKGARKFALSIKKIAKEHGVPIVENPLLARSLYAVVEVGALVPPEFYYTIAEVLSYVYSLDKNESLKK